MRPPEEIKKELLNQWLSKADEDFWAAEQLMEECRFPGVVGFHAQQAAEKYLKAFLTWHQVEFPKTHDIGKLLDLVSTVNDILASSLQDANILSVYGVDIRYPGDIPELTIQEAEKTVTLAEKVRDAIKAALI